jgi:hypothetical protein
MILNDVGWLGDITYLEAMGQPMIVLNTLAGALELLDKRAVNYSNRPWVPTMEMYVASDFDNVRLAYW